MVRCACDEVKHLGRLEGAPRPWALSHLANKDYSPLPETHIPVLKAQESGLLCTGQWRNNNNEAGVWDPLVTSLARHVANCDGF